jgi:hydrogenase maturation protease
MMHDRVLVLGVGNLLVGDEGVGVHVAQLLQQREWPEYVKVVDGGTGGFRLLDLLQSAPRVILIDATRDGLWPGSVNHFHAVQPSDFPPALGAHDIGLKALLTAASLLGELPEIEVITISVDDLGPTTMGLSPEVAAAIPVVERLVRQLVR